MSEVRLSGPATKPKVGFWHIFSTATVLNVGLVMMLFGLSGGFHPMHNVVHFLSGAVLLGFLAMKPTRLTTYMFSFGAFYTVLGVFGTADHQTVDATFLSSPYHPGHIFIGILAFIIPGVIILTTGVSIGRRRSIRIAR
jgi:hypothetical protein